MSSVQGGIYGNNPDNLLERGIIRKASNELIVSLLHPQLNEERKKMSGETLLMLKFNGALKFFLVHLKNLKFRVYTM